MLTMHDNPEEVRPGAPGPAAAEASAAGSRSIRLLDLVLCFSDALDFISPLVAAHHKQVTYIAYRIGREMNLSGTQLGTLVFSGTLHDIGAFSLKERIDLLRFDLAGPAEHAERGYALLREFSFLPPVAEAVRWHHRPWSQAGEGPGPHGDAAVLSNILHLSDRIAVLPERQFPPNHPESTARKIRRDSGTLFMPEAVEAFLRVSSDDSFGTDLGSAIDSSCFPEMISDFSVDIDSDHMLDFARLLSKIVDFKSPFTATHSSGVAASAEALARRSGFSDEQCLQMRIAGYMHDIGKLAVPAEVINKPAVLDPEERRVMEHHAFYTYHILQSITSFPEMRQWAVQHHERLDGSGYPFGLGRDAISHGSQVLAVADVFTALVEDRPYRRGLEKDSVLTIINEMADKNLLSSSVAGLLATHYREISNECIYAQRLAGNEFKMLSPEITN